MFDIISLKSRTDSLSAAIALAVDEISSGASPERTDQLREHVLASVGRVVAAAGFTPPAPASNPRLLATTLMVAGFAAAETFEEARR